MNQLESKDAPVPGVPAPIVDARPQCVLSRYHVRRTTWGFPMISPLLMVDFTGIQWGSDHI